MDWKEFLRPRRLKIIITIILFLIFPMFGTIESALAVYPSESYFGFIGTPGFYIVGGIIDIVEHIGKPYLTEQIFSFIRILPQLLIYLVLSYLVTCIILIKKSFK